MGICISNRKDLVSTRQKSINYSNIYNKSALILGNTNNLGYIIGKTMKNLQFNTILVNDSFDNYLNHYSCNDEFTIKQSKLTNFDELKNIFKEFHKEKLIYNILILNNIDIPIDSEFFNIITQNQCVNKTYFYIFIITNTKIEIDNIPNNITILEVGKQNNKKMNNSKTVKFITLFIKLLYKISIPKLEIS